MLTSQEERGLGDENVRFCGYGKKWIDGGVVSYSRTVRMFFMCPATRQDRWLVSRGVGLPQGAVT
jgi:hypothetical protein